MSQEQKRRIVFAHSWGGFVGWCREQGVSPTSGQVIYPEELSDLHGWDPKATEIVRGPGHFHHPLWSTKDRRMLSFRIRQASGEAMRGLPRLLSASSDGLILLALLSWLAIWGLWLAGLERWTTIVGLVGLTALPFALLLGWLTEHVGAAALEQEEAEG